LVANNLLLSAILGIVFVGTLYPLGVEAVTGEKLSVGPPYFNATAGPLTLLLVLFMIAGPLMRWRRDQFSALVRRMAIPVLVISISLLVLVLISPDIAILPFLGLMLAAGIGIGALAPLWRRNLRRTPIFTYGMVLAHLGVAVSLGGMASETAFIKETLVALNPGESRSVGPYQVTFAKLAPIAGPNWTALEATLEARRGDGEALILKPQARMFSNPPTETSEAAISTRLDGQLYLVLGKQEPTGRWQLRMWWKPFVTLIWLGGAMIAFGGLLALIGRFRRDKIAAYRKALA
jgi:cytochrome c-type biogenesis protein CcmF